ncbi:MAG TPA: hypothetical protein VGF97_06200 [Rhizomicrobium sp.]|jgi:tetratricopeptide (TPR) repeat protein
MKSRYLAALMVSAAAASVSPAAHAAVTVLGNGVAHSCYQYAEFGGNVPDGIAACSFALEQTALPARDRAATLINRGILRSRSDDPNGAITDYNSGLVLDSSLGEGYVDRGAALIVLQRYQDALTDIDKGISLNANLPQIAYYDRAVVHEALGDIRAAYEDYKKATEIQPDFRLAQDQLARFKVVRRQNDGT